MRSFKIRLHVRLTEQNIIKRESIREKIELI